MTGPSHPLPPLVSVVTPAYNQAVFLRETIESVLTQDYPSIEYLVIDDGSTDNTREILDLYRDRIQAESHANRGQTATINKGWSLCHGNVVTWLNSDDTFLPGSVRKAVDFLLKNPDVDIVFGDCVFTEADGKPLDQSLCAKGFDYLEFVAECHNPIAQPSAFIRRSVLDDIGMLDPHYFYFMDWEFWLRAGLKHRIVHIPELLSTYRLHPASNTVSRSARVAPELEYMYKKYFARTDLPSSIRALSRKAMANMYFTSGGYYLNGGDRRSARRMALHAIGANPSVFLDHWMLHKLLFCIFGGHLAYVTAREFYGRVKIAVSR